MGREGQGGATRWRGDPVGGRSGLNRRGLLGSPEGCGAPRKMHWAPARRMHRLGGRERREPAAS